MYPGAFERVEAAVDGIAKEQAVDSAISAAIPKLRNERAAGRLDPIP
jgi:hypothetical protein